MPFGLFYRDGHISAASGEWSRCRSVRWPILHRDRQRTGLSRRLEPSDRGGVDDLRDRSVTDGLPRRGSARGGTCPRALPIDFCLVQAGRMVLMVGCQRKSSTRRDRPGVCDTTMKFE